MVGKYVSHIRAKVDEVGAKAENKWAWAIERNINEAEGRGWLSFTSFCYFHHLGSGQSGITVKFRVLGCI